MKTCFVVCPIGHEGSAQRERSDTVLEFIIQPVCDDLGFQVTRVDKLYDVDRIDNTIIEHLKKADLVIADMTEHNPNAFYEMGFRHALEKPSIPIMEEGTKIPFDVANLRTITYVTNDLKKANEAKKRLRETIASFDIKENDGNGHFSEVNQHSNLNVLPYLLNIQDSLTELKTLVTERNQEMTAQTIDLAMNQIQKNSSRPEDKALEMFFSTMFNNPEKLESLMHFAEKFKNFK